MKPSLLCSLPIRKASLAMAALLGSAVLVVGCDRPAGQSASEASGTSTVSATSAVEEVAVAAPPANERPAPVAGRPPLRLEPPTLDFGFVAPSTASTGTIQLINGGTEPMKILAVQPSCKCTTINDIAGQTIPVGGSVGLEATLDAAPAPGPKKAQIRVLIEGYTEVVVVELKAEVALAIRVTPPYINAVEGKNQSGRLVVQSTDGKPFRICSTHGLPPRYLGFDPEVDEPRSQYLVEYDVAEFGERVPRYYVIETDRAEAPLIDVLLRHERSFPAFNIRMKDYRIAAGVVPAGGSGEFTIRLENKGDPVTAAISRSSLGNVELVRQESDAEEIRVELRLIPAADHRGFLYLPFTIFSQSGQSQDLDVFATVAETAGGSCASPASGG